MNDRSAIVDQRQRLLNRKQRSAHIQVEGLIDVLVGDLAQRERASLAGARKQDVDLALCSASPLEQSVEVVEIGHVTFTAGHVPADLLHGFIELLPASGPR